MGLFNVLELFHIRGGRKKFGLLPGVILTAWICAACSQVAKPPVPAQNPPASVPPPDVITVHYNERPPYQVTTATGVVGLTGDPVTIAFEKSRIPYQWEQTPSKRQIIILQQNEGLDCLVGWFKNPEREQFARYTLPIYQDKPQVALARADNKKINAVSTVDGILADTQLILLVKDSYSYGRFVDEKIARLDPPRVVTSIENIGMLKMVHANRADYFFIAPEEADSLIKTSGFAQNDFKVIRFSDMPAGEKRHIICSFRVDPDVIERLNTAIRQFVPTAPPE